MTRPNILIFFTDDQRFDTISALGSEVHTPNIDRLVARGTTFTHAHIPCGTDGAICMPSRAMLHTGRTLFHLRDGGTSIPREHTMLGETLRDAGYRTWGAGKWHNGREAFNRSFDDGDEIMFGGMADHWNVPVYHYDPTGRYDSRLPQIVHARETNEVLWREADHVHAGRHSSELLCDTALDFLGRQDGETPFFCYVSLLAPHDPRSMPERFRTMYSPEDVELPPNYLGGHPFDNGGLKIRDEVLADFPRTPEEIRRHIAEYRAMITHLDHEFGRVLDALDENGLAENTLIVFAGDNGLAVGQHGLMGKQNCYEHSVRVPLVFAGPGIPQGVRSEAFVYLLDIFPTLCELIDVQAPPTVEGQSLVAAIREPGTTVRDTLYFAYVSSQRAVKNRTHKLIEYAVRNRTRQTQLFDLANDPWETDNLAAKPGHEDVIADLRAQLLRFRETWEDGAPDRGQTFWERFDLPGEAPAEAPANA